MRLHERPISRSRLTYALPDIRADFVPQLHAHHQRVWVHSSKSAAHMVHDAAASTHGVRTSRCQQGLPPKLHCLTHYELPTATLCLTMHHGSSLAQPAPAVCVIKIHIIAGVIMLTLLGGLQSRSQCPQSAPAACQRQSRWCWGRCCRPPAAEAWERTRGSHQTCKNICIRSLSGFVRPGGLGGSGAKT